MATSGSAQQSLRKALGALKDSTTVGLAKVNSDYKELDVSIIKATNHVEVLAKEKHIRNILNAIQASRPRADVAYCIQSLARRLAKTRCWTVALKTLIVIHRAFREVDPTFREELINNSQSKGLVLNLSHFKDDSSPIAWDYSAWIRCYALYLEERLECFRILKFDVQTDPSKGKELDTPDLIEELPSLQQLLFRLLACQPEGAAIHNYMIQHALAIVASESVRIYVAITDRTVNLVDKFFDMQRHDAVRALEIYRKAGTQAEQLFNFFEVCRALEFGKGQKYIKIEQPPASFMTAMEDYVKEAPQALTLPWRVNNDDRAAIPIAICAPEPNLETDHKQDMDAEGKSEPVETLAELPKDSSNDAVDMPQATDLLGLNEPTREAAELDDNNDLALAIFTAENPSNSGNSLNMTSQATGWEIALVTESSSKSSAIAESKLAGGLDKLILDSLYDDALAKRSNQNGNSGIVPQVTTNPFETSDQDPFSASSNIVPPTNVQMATMAQQQAFMTQQNVTGNDPLNPFRNPFINLSAQSYTSQNPYPGLI